MTTTLPGTAVVALTTATSGLPHLPWSTVARLAAAACAATTGLVAMFHEGHFECVGLAGFAGPLERFQSERIFAATMRKGGEIVEVLAPAHAPQDAEHPYHHYAGLAWYGSDGTPLGILAVLGEVRRKLSADERDALSYLAHSMNDVFERTTQLARVAATNPQTSELLALSVFAGSPEPTLMYTRSEDSALPRLVGANAAWEHLFASPLYATDRSPLPSLQGERSDPEVLRAVLAAAVAGRSMRATMALYPAAQVEPRWMELWGYPVTLANGAQLWIEQLHDVTERVDRHRALIADRGRLQRTLASMADAVITLDADGRLQFMNSAARMLLDLRGMLPAEHLLQADERLLQLRDMDSEEPLVEPFRKRILGDGCKARALVMTRSGGRRYVEYVVSDVERPGHAPDGVVVLLRDITAEEVLTRQLSFEAGHDQLTGIANRRRFDQAFARALSTAKSDTQQHTLAFLDLDRFKTINDTCGHAAGDQVLREVAQLFKGQLRSHDVIARFGGDEFAILMHDCSPKTASRVINRIRAAIAMYRWHWQVREYTLGVSIGLAEITQETESGEQVLAIADAACYADKASHHSHERHLPTAPGESARAPISWSR